MFAWMRKGKGQPGRWCDLTVRPSRLMRRSIGVSGSGNVTVRPDMHMRGPIGVNASGDDAVGVRASGKIATKVWIGIAYCRGRRFISLKRENAYKEEAIVAEFIFAQVIDNITHEIALKRRSCGFRAKIKTRM